MKLQTHAEQRRHDEHRTPETVTLAGMGATLSLLLGLAALQHAGGDAEIARAGWAAVAGGVALLTLARHLGRQALRLRTAGRRR